MPSICNSVPAHAASATVLADAVREFVDRAVVPNEPLLAAGGAPAAAKMAELTARAREAGLWGLFYPPALGGKIASLEAYLPIAEQEGRSEYGPASVGSGAAPDAHMLHRHGGDAVRARFLAPLAAGEVEAAYGMSEPDGIGSIPATIATSAVLSDGRWTVNGRKWFISQAERAAFVTVVARTGHARDAAPESALSLIVVPTDAPGFRIERRLDVLGSYRGQCEISLRDVRVPETNLLGARDGGFDLMRQRLALGRTLRAMHWVGLAQRCFDLMCARICSVRGERARLPEKQLVRLRVFDAYRSIAGARALVRLAAARVDAQAGSDIEVNTAKVAASQALSIAADSAIQIFGAEGIGDLTPLSGIYRAARATHILDGADEALISAAGRRLLDAYRTDRTEPGR